MNGCPNGCLNDDRLEETNLPKHYYLYLDGEPKPTYYYSDSNGWFIQFSNTHRRKAPFCPFCGAKLEAPELDKKPLD